MLQLEKPGPRKQKGLAKVMLISTLVSDTLPASRKDLRKQMNKKKKNRKNNAVSEEGRRMLEATG